MNNNIKAMKATLKTLEQQRSKAINLRIDCLAYGNTEGVNGASSIIADLGKRIAKVREEIETAEATAKAETKNKIKGMIKMPKIDLAKGRDILNGVKEKITTVRVLFPEEDDIIDIEEESSIVEELEAIPNQTTIEELEEDDIIDIEEESSIVEELEAIPNLLKNWK